MANSGKNINIAAKTKGLVSIRQAASILSVSVNTVRRWDKAGKLSSVRPDGKNRYFSVEELKKIKPEQLLLISEAAQMLKVSPSTLRRLEKRGLVSPTRNKHGERRYSYETLQKFLNSEHFIHRKEAEEETLKPLRDQTEKTEALKQPGVGLAIKRLISEDHSNILRLRWRFGLLFGVSAVVLAPIVILVAGLVAAFLINPGPTAKRLGLVYIGSTDQASRVKAAYTDSTQDPAKPVSSDQIKFAPTAGWKNDLRPFVNVALFLVRHTDSQKYAVAAHDLQISDVNSVFQPDEKGGIRSLYPLSLGSSKLSISDPGLVFNLNSDLLQGKRPGNNSGDIAVLPLKGGPGGAIADASITTTDIANGAITSNKLAPALRSSINVVNTSYSATGTILDSSLSPNVTLQGNGFNGASQLVQLDNLGVLPVLSGANLTSLNGTNISSGTVANARLSTNVTLQGNTFNGVNQLVQLTAGGILPVLSGANLTSLNATNISTGTVADTRLSTNVTLQGNGFNLASQLVQLTSGGLLPVLNGSNLTNLSASNISSGNFVASITSGLGISGGNGGSNGAALTLAVNQAASLSWTGTETFTTLTSTGASTIATGSSLTNTFGSGTSANNTIGAGASSVNTIGSATTPGALTLRGVATFTNLIQGSAGLDLLGTTSGGLVTAQPILNLRSDNSLKWQIGLDVANSVNDDFALARGLSGGGVADIIYLKDVSGTGQVAIGLSCTPPASVRVQICGASNAAANGTWPSLQIGQGQGQTGDALKIINSAGNGLAKFDTNGALYGVDTAVGTYGLKIVPTAVGNVALTVRGLASQTADVLQVISNGSSTQGIHFAPDGNDTALYIKNTSDGSTNISLRTAGSIFTTADYSTPIAIASSTTNSTRSGNLGFRDNKTGGAESIFVRKEGTGLSYYDNGGILFASMNTAGGSGSLTIQGGGTLSLLSTSTSAISLDSGTTGNVNIGTGANAKTIQIGTTTGAVAQTINIGNNATASSTSTLVLGSTVAGTTTLQSAGGVAVSTLGTANTVTYLCRNSSNLIGTCQTAATGAAFLQGGNSFGATAVLGTNDNNSLQIRTNSLTQATIAAGGATTFKNSTDSTTAFQIQNSAGTSNLFVADTTNSRIIMGTTTSYAATLTVNGNLYSGDTSNTGRLVLVGNSGAYPGIWFGTTSPTLTNYTFLYDASNGSILNTLSGQNFYFRVGNATKMILDLNGNVGIGATAPGARLDVKGSTTDNTASVFNLQNSGAVNVVNIKNDGTTLFQNSTNSTTAFQVQNLAGNNYILVNTSGAAVEIGNGGIASTIQIGNTTGAVAQTINIGNNATASSTTTVTLGSTIGASATTIQAGTGEITLKGHLKATQTTAPTAGTPTACGTTPTAAVTAGSTDNAGSFTITAGTGTPGSCVVVISFNAAFAATPKAILLQPTTAVGSATGGKTANITASATGSFTATMTGTAPAASEVNSYYYWVME